MRKRTGITLETHRNKPLRTLITSPSKKLDQSRYQTTTSPTTTETNGSTSTASASPIIIDITNPLTVDDIPSGQTLTERLTLASGQYCPSLPVNFYRRVWFDGLEAFESIHFTVDVNTQCVLPSTSLNTNVVVTASYVKA